MSLSARRAWIEIANFCKNRFCPTVALRKESVDRNLSLPNSIRRCLMVALRKESVDRNNIGLASFRACIVALRKESVDRNIILPKQLDRSAPSLSARRAWIEIGA